MRIKNHLLSMLALSFTIASSQTASAFPFYQSSRDLLACYTLNCPHWYVGANLGVSHLHDRPNSGSGNSVNQNGPGASVLAGFQFDPMFGVELGYSQYKNSRETSNPIIIAKTEHYAVHLAGTIRVPLYTQISAIGKLGAAYNYAQKMAIASGFAKTANAGSLYWGLGLAFSITPKVDFIAQFAEAVGNHLTGSADLWSLGFNFAIV